MSKKRLGFFMLCVLAGACIASADTYCINLVNWADYVEVQYDGEMSGGTWYPYRPGGLPTAGVSWGCKGALAVTPSEDVQWLWVFDHPSMTVRGYNSYGGAISLVYVDEPFTVTPGACNAPLSAGPLLMGE